MTVATAESALVADWRFVSLAARALGDAALAARYAADPRSVLAEQGIELAAGESAPALGAPLELTELSSAGALRDEAFVAATHICFIDASR